MTELPENTLTNKRRRMVWVDTAKALAMLMIIFGHISIGTYAQAFVFAFHVPVFIFISGFCFNGREKFGLFLKKKFLRIMVPYYFFGLFAIAAYQLFGSYFSTKTIHSVKDCLFGLLIGNTKSDQLIFNLHLWFLPFIFVMLIIFYGLKKLSDVITQKAGIKSIYGYLALFVVTMVISASVLTYRRDIYFPFSAEIAVRNLPFFSLGFLMKEYGKISGDICRNNKKNLVKATGVFLVSTAVLIFFADKNICHISDEIYMVNYHRDSYGVPLYFYCAAFAGIVAVVALSKILPEIKGLTYLGKNTIALLVMQKFAIMPIRVLFDKLPDSIGNNTLICFLSTIIVVMICLAADYLIKKFLPFLYGMKYNKVK